MFFKYFYCFSKNKCSKDVRIFEQTSVADVAEQYPKKLIQYSDAQPFVPPITNGQVIKVYDGDTFTLAAYLPYNESPLYRFSVRLRGIDTPEIKGGTEEEKELAILARTELSNMIMNKTVVLTNVGSEKYGRILADVYVGGVHVNQHMLDTKHALPYDGGTKIGFSDFKKGGFEKI
jgi:micrococcal nuclease